MTESVLFSLNGLRLPSFCPRRWIVDEYAVLQCGRPQFCEVCIREHVDVEVKA